MNHVKFKEQVISNVLITVCLIAFIGSLLSVRPFIKTVTSEIKFTHVAKEYKSNFKKLDENKKISTIKIVPENSKSVNYAFDVPPSKYISKLITEKGVIDANEKSIKGLKEI